MPYNSTAESHAALRKRKKVVTHCLRCGEHRYGYPQVRYCGTACKLKAFRDRKRQAKVRRLSHLATVSAEGV